MSKKQVTHTPGPWNLKQKSIAANEGSYYGANDQYIGMFSFAIDRPALMKEAKEIGLANAKVIAASPTMLEVLQEIVEYIGYDTEEEYVTFSKELYKKAKSAIKLATT